MPAQQQPQQQPAQQPQARQPKVYGISSIYRSVSEAVTKSAMAVATVGDVALNASVGINITSAMFRIKATEQVVEGAVAFCTKYNITVKSTSEAITMQMEHTRLVEELLQF